MRDRNYCYRGRWVKDYSLYRNRHREGLGHMTDVLLRRDCTIGDYAAILTEILMAYPGD
jgi:hypothetical protein